VIKWAHTRSTSDQGRVALSDLAAHDALPDAEIGWVLDSLGFSGDASSRRRAFVNAQGWLATITDFRSLPRPILLKLLDYATERGAAGDDAGERQALRFILKDSIATRPPLDPRIAAMISAIGWAVPLPPDDWTVEQIGLVARSGVTLSSGQREVLHWILEPDSFGGLQRVVFSEEDKGETQAATQIGAGLTSTHLIALSRAVIGRSVDHDLLTRGRVREFLETALADGIRAGVQPNRLREPVIATAMIWEQDSTGGLDAEALRHELRCCAIDVAARRARIDTAVAALLLMPQPKQDLVIKNLTGYWRDEQEPEVKLAIATVIIRALTHARA
jgi:hypothetical protein